MPKSLHIVQRTSSDFVAHGAFAILPNLRQSHDMQLTAIRTLRGLTMRQLGDMIGMDASTVQRAEAMSSTSKLRTYQLCADALGVTLADIFSEDRTALELALLDVFRRIPADRHDEVVRLLSLAATPPHSSGE